MKRLLLIGSLAALSCGSGPNPGNDMAGGDLATGGGVTIPDPGASTMVENNFGNVEPNDTPAHATPLGTAMSGNVYCWVNGNSIGGNDTSDYFVFKTGPSTGEFTLGASGLCFMGSITGLTATLWKVVNNHQVMPPIHKWVSMGTCVKSTMGDAPTEASTVYLLGVEATGGAGTYAA